MNELATLWAGGGKVVINNNHMLTGKDVSLAGQIILSGDLIECN
jgi:FKBP-type peptidyl-prolyl cis-trans isomerase 2